MSHNQKQLVLGSLLGDGYCNRERQFLRFSQCLKQKEYLDYKYSFFNENETSKIYERLYKEGYVSYSFEFYNKFFDFLVGICDPFWSCHKYLLHLVNWLFTVRSLKIRSNHYDQTYSIQFKKFFDD